MAVTMDTEVGGAAANSYCSLSDANIYHEMRGFNEVWANAADPVKEKHLTWATRIIDRTYATRFIGAKASHAQALAWPRFDAADEGGFYYEGISTELKEAVAEFAFQLMTEDWTQGLGSVTDEGTSLPGGLRLSKERHNPIPAPVLTLLSQLLRHSGGSIELVMS